MRIDKAQFLKGVVHGGEFSNDLPQVAFYGRSNAGKSSSMNAILSRKALAKSSGTPGKTRELNLFNINDTYLFVDLPGYGFAKVSKVARQALRKLIMWYIHDVPAPNRINVFVLDAKVGLTDLDKDVLTDLVERNEEIIILLNKIDKLNQSARVKLIREMESEIPPHVPVIQFSALKGRGVKEFWELFEEK
jgi:GTP-binding protein